MPRIRDHPCITSGKDWMGGFKKWQCLLTFKTVYKYADFTPLGGGWFRKGPKMCWRNTYMDGPLLNFIYAEKATKFQEVSFLLVRTLLSNFKTKREISSNLCGLLRKSPLRIFRTSYGPGTGRAGVQAGCKCYKCQNQGVNQTAAK